MYVLRNGSITCADKVFLRVVNILPKERCRIFPVIEVVEDRCAESVGTVGGVANAGGAVLAGAAGVEAAVNQTLEMRSEGLA